MGDPKFSRKKYEKPVHPWQADRIEEEKELIKKYGLKNKREIWRARSTLRNFRRQARLLFPKLRIGDKQAQKEAKQLISKLVNLGILNENANLDDILALTIESLLSRRFQSVVYKKGLASTFKQARQLIVHGHVGIGNRKVTIPSYMVKKSEEAEISYIDSSPLVNELHPVRPKPQEITSGKEIS
ncbi:MAG: 30S ribosomal protein S4 [Candidatus Thermoplasmatota archaeon]|nr:30S ribosomal protein S4 [Candidatus Thermoplasmatota archaeon]